MRILAALLISLSLFAATPGVSFAEETLAAASEAQLSHEHAIAPADEAVSGLSVQEIVVGTAVLGGVLAAGVLATGSLSTGIMAASAVVLVYTFMP